MRQYCKKYRQNEQNPFAVVSWQDDFLYKLQELVDCFIQEQNISMQDIVLVFPNARPKRYLTARYKKSAGQKQQAGILPQIYTSSEFYALCLHHFERGQSLFSEQEPLDRYAKLYEIVKNILQKKRNTHFSASVEIRQLEAGETDVSYKKEENGVLQMAKFYPWAESLDMLFEECFQHLIFPRNIEYADGEVSPFAQSLLADLKEIFTEYVRSMQEKRQSTPAYGLFRTARYIESYYQYQNGKTPEMADMPFEKNKGDAECFSDFMPYLLQGKCIIFAGFVSVSQAEEVILKYFWERGACLCFHTDSRLVTDIRALHYSCEEHGKWLQKWRAEAYLLGAGGERKPKISFLPAYDVHSQLQSLKKTSCLILKLRRNVMITVPLFCRTRLCSCLFCMSFPIRISIYPLAIPYKERCFGSLWNVFSLCSCKKRKCWRVFIPGGRFARLIAAPLRENAFGAGQAGKFQGKGGASRCFR